VFCWLKKVPFRPLFDELAIAAALILGFGRIGNFIDGQIVGSVTDVPWAVKFPEADGFRHPVVLYDGVKNFLLVPLLLWVRRRGAPPGRLAALFVFLYAGLRLPIDVFREYPITTLGLPTGQAFNLIMASAGLLLLARNWWVHKGVARPGVTPPVVPPERGMPVWRPAMFAAMLALALVIPSDATRDVPEQYGKRHPGLSHSWLYPDLDLGGRFGETTPEVISPPRGQSEASSRSGRPTGLRVREIRSSAPTRSAHDAVPNGALRATERRIRRVSDS
jgi:phosphatidylglycerol:prolipoprotein diacylglycerol transferase